MRSHSRPPGAGSVTAESWARAMFGDAPDAGQRFILTGLLRLRLAPIATFDTVVGVVVAENTAQDLRLEADSPLLRRHIVVRVEEAQVSLATVMGYRRRRGRITWQLVSAIHRRVAPGLLRETARAV